MAKAWKSVPVAMPRAPCTICGGDAFERGPGGRTGPTGVPPRCVRCRSLERHRAFRLMFQALPRPDMAKWSVLQFSVEPTLDPDWFASFEVSVFGGPNSLDLMAIDRPDGAYDMVMCNNVLEHVADDRAAICELARIAGGFGFVFLAVPDPLNRSDTDDWGVPDPAKHGHYRIYGRDIENMLEETLPYHSIIEVIAPDPVSGVDQMAYVLTRRAAVADWLMRRLPASRRLIGRSNR